MVAEERELGSEEAIGVDWVVSEEQGFRVRVDDETQSPD